MKNAIREFQGSHRWLSNFWPSPVVFDSVSYPTVEHAYQAAKTLDDKDRKRIHMANTPGEAKRLGRYVRVRDDWDKVKPSIMLYLLQQKFEAPELKQKLLATGDAELIEGNKWGDKYWGVCNGKGLNVLGKLIMQVREQLKWKD